MARTPRPGSAVRGSRTGRPLMVLLDLLGRRWMLRIIWELRGGALTFRALREACGDVSPTVLNTRIKELRDSGLVTPGEEAEGYTLTPLGHALLERIHPLRDFAEHWAKRG